jgi:hypothetical protein
MPKKPRDTDFSDLKENFESGELIKNYIYDILPNTSTCSRLIYFIANHQSDLNKQENIYDIIGYVDEKQLDKDGSYYSAVINVLSNYNDIKLQQKYMKEMKTYKISLRICHYQHYIQSCSNLFYKSPSQDKFNNIFSSIKEATDSGLEINDELFIIMFWIIEYAHNKSDIPIENINSVLINVFVLLSDNIDILNTHVHTEFINMINKFDVITDDTFQLSSHEGCTEPHNLCQRQLTTEVYDNMCKLWSSSFESQMVRRILKNALKHFKHFTIRFLDPAKPIVIIDGANLGYAVNLKKCKNFYRKIDTAVKYFQDNGWNVIIFLHKSHIDKYDSDDNRAIIESWKNNTENNVVRYDINAKTHECSDDFVWILAGFYYNAIRPTHNAYVLTNDQMKNHHGDETLNNKLFFRWRNNHQITYDFEFKNNNKTGFMDFAIVPHMPPTFDHFTQFRYDGTCKQLTIYLPFSRTEQMKKRNERSEKEVGHIERFHDACKTIEWNKKVIKIDIQPEHYPSSPC